MIGGPSHVQARVAEIQARVASPSVGPSPRGGGVVGGGMSEAMRSAEQSAGATARSSARAASTTGTPDTATARSASATAPAVARTAPATAPAARADSAASASAVAAAQRAFTTSATGASSRDRTREVSGGDVSRASPGWQGRLPSAGRPWASAIERAAAEHGLRPELLGALVWSESGFRAEAVSPAGARGLGQLMPGTATELGVDPDDPAQNLDGAARYLRAQLDRFGDTELALAAYNAGPGRVADAGGVPNIRETTTYVARVSQRARALGGVA